MNISVFIKLCVFITLIGNYFNASAYWQQRVNYEMSVTFEVKNHQFNGTQRLTYFNNSPDTLKRVFYHLYFNAFQPNSMMDVRSRTLADPDKRVGSRIAALDSSQIGFESVSKLTQDGINLTYTLSETVLEVVLDQPILPGASTVFEMEFNGQVPLQIRRSGRESYEGIAYSMAQWYPKMAEYDELGWHTSPYVAREFYAPWGDFDVKIEINSAYVLAGTGVLQNPNEMGFGYEKPGTKVKRKKKTATWHFKAENVHDFVWVADPDYKQTTIQVPDGPLLRFFYQPGENTQLWEELPSYCVKAFQYMNSTYGKYAWSEYSFIQGGDGGMEYPMATLIANDRAGRSTRSLNSLVGVAVHELIHSWFQGMLATNESYFAWMDEGFTSFAEDNTLAYIMNTSGNPHAASYKSYFRWVATGEEEPMTTHSDYFSSNMAYSRGSYTKGAIALKQLSYVMGQEVFMSGMKAYFNKWKMKHPDMNDFIKVMEDQSGLDLKWYFNYWVGTTKTIDYGINSVVGQDAATQVELERIQEMPMPIDLLVTLNDGTQIQYYIPLGIMRGEKANETDLERVILKDWNWTHPTYTFTLDKPLDQIKSIEIDPSMRMADIERSNNIYPAPAE